MEIINPPGWTPPKGYNNGMKAKVREVVFIAGQVAWDAGQNIVGPGDFVAQFDQALANVLSVVAHAGAGPEAIGKLTIFVTDKQEYLKQLKQIGQVYRQRMGKHYPAMTLVEAKSLLEEGALVEIEGIAVIE